MRNIKVSVVKLLFLGVAMLMLGASNVMAQVNVSLPNITRQHGAPQEEINLTVSSLNGQNVAGYTFTVTYDKNVVYLTEATNAGTLSEGGIFVQKADTANGTLKVAWANGSAISGSGTLVKIKVQYRNYGTTALDLGSSFLFNEGNPAVAVTNGSIAIPSLAVKFADTTATVGDTILVPITTSQLNTADNVVSYQFNATFNPAVLSVVGIQTTGTLSATGLAQYTANNTAGTFSVAWAAGSPVSGSGELLLVKVAVKAAGTSALSFSSFTFNEGTPNAGLLGGSLIASAVSTYSVSGKVVYNNAASSPLAGVIVTLSGAKSAVDTTDAAGNYSFTGLVAGTYNVAAAKTTGWGGVNATDALLAQKAFLGTVTLDSLQKLAGDVNNSGAINNSDALDIVKRYVGQISAFTKADWVLLPASEQVVLSTSSKTVNIEALATGDINASLAIGSQKVIALSLDENISINALAKETVEVPVKVSQSMILGAASLQIAYPANLLEFKGVKSGNIQFVSNVKDGVVSLAWADLNGAGKNAVELNANDVLATLVFTAKTIGHASFTLDANSELADNEGTVIKGSVAAPAVNITSPSSFALKQNYPNPFNPSTKISYAIPEAGNVTLTIYNITGQEVAKLVNGAQAAGSHEVTWTASNLSSGVYFYEVRFEGAGRNFSDIKSMILLK